MSGFKLFRCTDDNAPVLSGTRGSLVNLLRKCLVDGYGTKTPAPGWTLEFINATEDVAVFRNSPTLGTGSFMRIDEVTTTYAYQANMTAFEIMTDVDNGAGSFGGTWTVAKSNAASTASRWWFLFASPTMLHLVIYASLAPGTNPTPATVNTLFGIMTFGDFVPYNAESRPAVAGYTYTNASNAVYGLIANSASNHNARSPRNYASAPGSVLLFGAAVGTWAYSTGNVMAGVLYNGKLLLAKVYVQDNTTDWSLLRGVVPGIFVPCHPSAGFSLPFLSTYDGPGDTTYIVLPWNAWAANTMSRHVAFEFDTE